MSGVVAFPVDTPFDTGCLPLTYMAIQGYKAYLTGVQTEKSQF